MIDIKAIVLELDDGYQARLMFRQYLPDGDWICVVDPEFMQDLQNQELSVVE